MAKINSEKRNEVERRNGQFGLHENWNHVERRKKSSRRKKDWGKNLRVEDLPSENNVDKQFLKQLRRKQKEKKLKDSRKKGRIKKELRNK